MLYTTARLLHAAGTYDDRYGPLLSRHAGDESPIPVVELIEFAKGMPHELDHPFLALRCCTEPEEAKRVSQVLALKCAEHVERHFSDRYPDDLRVRNCNAIVSRFLAGNAAMEEVMACGFAAQAAARDAALNSYPTIADVAWAAAAAAVDAFYTATRSDAEDAGWAAWATAQVAVDAAGEEEQDWQFEQFRALLLSEC